MRRKYDSGYKELLEKVRERLPKCYGVLVSNKHPEISRTRCYNIMSHGIQDWDALKAMAETFNIELEETKI